MKHSYDTWTGVAWQQRATLCGLVIALVAVQIGRWYWIAHQRKVDERVTN